MDYEDRLTITTPEGLELDLRLAGLGSRFLGQLLDLTIKALTITLLIITLVALDLAGVAILLPSTLLVVYAYDVVFEVLAGGRTPGKMAFGLRVVRLGGEPVDFVASAIRNVLRIVDGIPLSYVPGIVSILATKRNQRLGDLAAGTLVIRDEPSAAPQPAPGAYAPPAPGAYAPPAPGGLAPPPGSGPAWDVSAVRAEEAAAVRSFLDRRSTLAPGVRGQLAEQLATALRPKVGGVPDGLPPEPFLEQLAAQKAARG